MTDDTKREGTGPDSGAVPTTSATPEPTGATPPPTTGATPFPTTSATASPATEPPVYTAPAPTAAPSAAPAPTDARPHPAQFGTIVWGFVLLALCGFVGITQFGPGVDADRYLWAFIGVIAAGVALVAVGIAAAFRR